MSAPYGSVTHALSRAFSAPRPHFSSSSLWSAGVRGYDDLTSSEKIALDGIVQTIAIARCRPMSVRCFRILWDDEAAMVVEAMVGVIDGFRKPSRRPPSEFCIAVIQRWAAPRMTLKVPKRSDRQWAKIMNVDHKTVGLARRELRELLVQAYAAGLRTMEIELTARGLIPSNQDEDVA